MADDADCRPFRLPTTTPEERSVPLQAQEISFQHRAVVPVETSEGADEGDVFEFPAKRMARRLHQAAQPVIEPVRAEIDADEPAWDVREPAGGSTAPTDTVVETTKPLETGEQSCDRGRRRPAIPTRLSPEKSRRMPRRWISQIPRSRPQSQLRVRMQLGTHPRQDEMNLRPQSPCREHGCAAGRRLPRPGGRRP